MPDSLTPRTDSAALLKAATAALASVLAALPEPGRAIAWQDGLDLLATIGGLKPLCLVGRGFHDPDWSAALVRVAEEAALSVLEAAPWFPAAEPGFFPDWYVVASARRKSASVIYLCGDVVTRQRAEALSARGRVSAADEALILGYPLCCVAQHHQRSLAFERLTITMLERVAGGDDARMARLVAAGVEPTPTTAEERRRYAALAAIAPSAWTSVNQCDACVADPMGPAASLARRYADLAGAAGYPSRT